MIDSRANARIRRASRPVLKDDPRQAIRALPDDARRRVAMVNDREGFHHITQIGGRRRRGERLRLHDDIRPAYPAAMHTCIGASHILARSTHRAVASRHTGAFCFFTRIPAGLALSFNTCYTGVDTGYTGVGDYRRA
jgi:hypothetical protein